MPIFNVGDVVEVRASKCGYQGPGKIVGTAWGIYLMVAIDDAIHPVITVRATNLVHRKEGDCDVRKGNKLGKNK